ncbi:MAG TPA: methyltransferase domain-containing protein [Acidimicrobiales bacterium]|nr:methyltransferase domain-containing protein [Acidimicrobiales bacterium]
MPFRMPVRDLAGSYQEMRDDLTEMVQIVRETPAQQAAFAKHLNRPGVIFQYAYYAALVRQFVESPSSVIVDWGGQYGHVTRLLRRYYENVVCYLPDSSEFEARHFHARFGIEDSVRFGPGYGHAEIALPDRSADAVISSGVLEHTREFGVTEAASLAEIRRILRPGGWLFVWNLPRRWGSVELLNSALRRSVHAYKYRRPQVEALLAEAGFHVELVDAHELVNLSTRNTLGRLVGDVRAWKLDYYLSKIFLLGAVCQHFTIVARMPEKAAVPAAPVTP